MVDQYGAMIEIDGSSERARSMRALETGLR
jgi:hypothetical protein